MNMTIVAIIVGAVCMIAAARKARAARENEINKYIAEVNASLDNVINKSIAEVNAEVNASLDKFVAELKDLPA